MAYRVLGPLEVTADGRPAPLGAPKQRAVLALLLLHDGETVPVRRLVDALWPEGPPRSAVKNVQLYVHHLRRLLGTRLTSSPAGYRLQVGEDLDLSRFRRLLDEARQAIRTRAADLAAARYRQALALWRGPAIADLVDRELLIVEAAHLEELRLQALDECLELELGLGRHTELIPELTRLAAEHPVHEPVRAHHIRALRAAGRDAEAVAAYRDACAVLERELGCRPGVRLRQLGQALQADPPRHRRVDAVPPAPGIFVGRFTEQAALTAAADGGRCLVVLTGPAGAGKSALAVRLAHQLSSGYGGSLHADLLGATPGVAPADPGDLATGFLRRLGVAPEQIPTRPETALATWRRIAAERRLLVVLDNAADAGQVRDLLPGRPAFALVTARRPLAELPDAAVVPVGPLPSQDAYHLLGVLTGADRLAADPVAARQVTEWCARLPLTLHIAARLAGTLNGSLGDVAARLADESRRLDQLDQGDSGIRGSLKASYAGLRHPLAERVFRLLGMLDIPEVSTELLRFAARADQAVPDDPDPVATALSELVAVRLVEEPAPGRYQLHDLLRLFARERAAEAGETAAELRERALTHQVATAWRASTLLQPADPNRIPRDVDPGAAAPLADRAAAAAWCEAERGNLVTAIRNAATDPSTAKAATSLARALFWFFRTRSYPQDWLAVCRAALSAARLLGDPCAEAMALTDLGAALERSYAFVEAAEAYRAGLEIVRRVGPRRQEGVILMNLGIVHWRCRELDRAADCLRRSLAVREEIGDQIGAARVNHNLGLVHVARRDYDTALACYRRAIEVFTARGDHDGLTRCHGNLCELERERGRSPAAVRHGRRALLYARDLGDRQTEGLLLLDLAETYRRAGRLTVAARHCLRGLATCRSVGYAPGEAEALHRLGLIRASQGRAPEAEGHWRAALAIFAELAAPEADDLRERLGTTPGGPYAGQRRPHRAVS